ncbi:MULTISPECIES: histidine kinase [Kitasatospora]|uniref:histidine kinase n=1 Tax=Kitasatospora setae (strain ATCC 33774 / DSM 43861 / JCM 3304 / KCC A-0304 / NBRC 14216 / KM-6054) TaxID=452652 RepID=E4N6G1_KITSK|nr:MULTISPECIES: histidine kinase [Kitasatospora]BAJ26792.1 putative two-component system sensor kinase [Kitasatospora setae KM-6054]
MTRTATSTTEPATAEPATVLRRLPPAVRESVPPLLFLPPLLLHAAATRPAAGLPLAAVLTVALVLPLAWRWRAPRAVFGAVAGAALVQWLAGVQLPADAALLVALHGLAARTGRRGTLLAGAVAEAGALLACLRWAGPGAFPATFVALTATVVAAAALGTGVRTGRAHLAVLAERAAHLEQRQEQLARLAVAEERTRIAREVHDIVTHNLSVMVALADAAVHAREQAPDRAATAMLGVSETGRQALADMRRSLGLLRADAPDPDGELQPLPGVAELAELAERMRAAGLPTRVDVRGDAARLPATAQLTVYRLVQEALTNTFKHAPTGTCAEVRIDCSARAVTVDVTDDNPAAARLGARSAPPGHGLSGMRERAAAYGGTLRAGPLPGGGWGVHTRLRLDGAAAASG